MNLLIDDDNTKVWKGSLTCTNGLYETLKDNLDWIYGSQTVYGKTCNIPRGMYFFGDKEVKMYKYSALSFPVQPWESSEEGLKILQILEVIREEIQTLFPSEVTFNSCLMNYYKDGKDYIAHHKDKEALGDYNAVVTVSLGTQRKFVLKKGKEKVETMLEDGDVIIMSSVTETDWTHSIPKVAISKCNAGRISLTFRKIK